MILFLLFSLICSEPKSVKKKRNLIIFATVTVGLFIVCGFSKYFLIGDDEKKEFGQNKPTSMGLMQTKPKCVLNIYGHAIEFGKNIVPLREIKEEENDLWLSLGEYERTGDVKILLSALNISESSIQCIIKTPCINSDYEISKISDYTDKYNGFIIFGVPKILKENFQTLFLNKGIGGVIFIDINEYINTGIRNYLEKLKNDNYVNYILQFDSFLSAALNNY